ncbi:hypothetical protein VQ03_09070 [Methylobacterium tarhaniae]|uniref:Uncharacterized protein n=2 Tax=Methylobacterium tarhaniae TaxID=1187852 RepID=A0A0J6TC92_9HYPH|nr:hypothetical protein VQ03_09070 [Methylobacterium tarhaniae]
MNLRSRQTFGRVGTAAGRSAGGLSLGDAARRNADDGRRASASDDDRHRSQRLAAAKQFDLDGQIG